MVRITMKSMDDAKIVKKRFIGCLLGGAVGDALGAPVEFKTKTEIFKRFGSEGITKYEPAYGRLGAITDDTQMTLFTAEGLLRAWVRGSTKGITTYSGVTANAYLRWLKTQSGWSYDEIQFEYDDGWLYQQRELHYRRAPGNTCLSALREMKRLGESAKNDSKGCGGVMRVAPVGLFAWHFRHQQSPQQAFNLGVELAALTHGHPTGVLTSGVFAVLIFAIVDGLTLTKALKIAKTYLLEKTEHEETLLAIEKAEFFATQKIPHDEAIAKLGQGWIAEEALAISIYCSLVASNFKEGVLLAVNHDGDSDSTGSITGNLLGAMYGVNKIPVEWLDNLELRDVITEIAEDLYSFYDLKLGEYSDDEASRLIFKKYPGC
ncbi:MAG: ADP-ribosylglycohydrolase family protein [Methylococcales bacterium]|nr:ADP-ribosylglycohydrolase family protein [Methylococcales bacterium]